MKKVIAIFNAPQECGCPFITFINAENGQVIKSIDLEYEDLFYEAGIETVVSRQPTGRERFTTIISAKPPMVGEVVYEEMWVVAEVTITNNDNDYIKSYRVREIEVVEKVEYKYLDHNKDEYIQKMTELGFDMTGWCHYRRCKMGYTAFLEAIVKTYNKDWEILNFIRI